MFISKGTVFSQKEICKCPTVYFNFEFDICNRLDFFFFSQAEGHLDITSKALASTTCSDMSDIVHITIMFLSFAALYPWQQSGPVYRGDLHRHVSEYPLHSTLYIELCYY